MLSQRPSEVPLLGYRTKQFKLFNATSLEALVPIDHVYRQLEEKLDLSFVRGVVRNRYEETAHPSIDLPGLLQQPRLPGERVSV